MKKEHEKIILRLDGDVLKKLRAIKEREGVPVSTQIRKAIDAWLDKR